MDDLSTVCFFPTKSQNQARIKTEDLRKQINANNASVHMPPCNARDQEPLAVKRIPF